MIPLVARFLPFISKNGVALALVGVLAFQYVQVRGLRNELAASNQRNEQFKEALARANQTIVRLDEASKHLPVGESKTIFVEVPKFIGFEKPVPVIVTRTEKTIETKLDTITLPPERIKEIIEKSVQSLVLDVTATRDIKTGEKFRIVASQVAPGVYQTILEPGSPVKVDTTVVTPIDKIPQPVAGPSDRRFFVTLYGGFSSLDQGVIGIRPTYRFNQTFGFEGQVECRGVQFSGTTCRNGIDYRVVATVTF